MISLHEILLLSFVSFISASFSALSGGAGLINIPSIQLFKFSALEALATNKLVITASNLASLIALMRKKYFHPKPLHIVLAFLSLIASGLGALFTTHLPTQALNTAIPLMIFVIGFRKPLTSLVRFFLPSKHRESALAQKQPQPLALHWLIILFFCAGFYMGFIGIAGGVLLLILTRDALALPLLEAAAISRMCAFASNITSFIIFALHKKVIFSLGIPMLLAGIAGSYAGVHIWSRVDKRYIDFSIYALVLIEVFVLLWKHF